MCESSGRPDSPLTVPSVGIASAFESRISRPVLKSSSENTCFTSRMCTAKSFVYASVATT